MDRKEFLSQISFGAAVIVFSNCLSACKKSVPEAASNVNLTLDLSTSQYDSLLTKGNALIVNDGSIIIAHTLDQNSDVFIAVSVYCTHEGVNVDYQSGSNQFYCSAHGSAFSNTGSVLHGPAKSSLKQYTVTKTGNLLTIKG